MMILVLIEVGIYIISRISIEVKELLRKLRLNPYPFAILLDLGKEPRLKVGGGRVFKTLLLLAGIINFVLLLGLFYYTLLPAAISLISSTVAGEAKAESPFVPVVPGVTVSLTTIPYILLAASIAIAAHELMHAVAAFLDRVPVESWGIGIFIIFPLAYVKVNEEVFSKTLLRVKARILSAGVLANALLALLAIAIMPAVTAGLSTQVVIMDVVSDDPNAPAAKAGLPVPSIINAINGTSINSVYDLKRVLKQYENDTVVLALELTPAVIDDEIVKPIDDTSVYYVNKPAGRWRLGIYVGELFSATTPRQSIMLGRFLFWFYIVNISLGVFNAAPLYITDGGRLISEILSKYGLGSLNNVVQSGTVLFTVILLLLGFMRFI
jgi:membrane-associated protease RseP (regulator of RpoE activity)